MHLILGLEYITVLHKLEQRIFYNNISCNIISYCFRCFLKMCRDFYSVDS